MLQRGYRPHWTDDQIRTGVHDSPTFAKVAGEAAAVIHERFLRWLAASEFPDAIRAEIDDFAVKLKANAASPPVLYFNEWADMWSTGDLLPNMGNEEAVAFGNGFEAWCHVSPIKVDEYEERINRLTVGGKSAQEARWLLARLREAEDAWAEMLRDNWVLIVLREVLGPTVTDEEIEASLYSIPKWLERK
jgi:hypothetical protein